MPRSKTSKGNTGPVVAGSPCAFYTNITPAEEAVSCSTCSELVHRYCATVSMKGFASISENNPFTCASCKKEAFLLTVNEMENTISALKAEINELCTAMSDLSNKQQEQEQAFNLCMFQSCSSSTNRLGI